MTIRNYNIEVGDMFGRWRVVRGPYMKKPHMSCDCVCTCGAMSTIRCSRLVDNESKSCGCLAHELAKTHGKSKSRAYYAFGNMHGRCYDLKDKKYYRYGARGIVVCKRWHVFENFYRDMGDPPVGKTLNRIDNDGNYCKENCEWSSAKDQARNRSTSLKLTYNGETHSLVEWSEILGIKYCTLQKRRQSNWPIHRLLSPTK